MMIKEYKEVEVEKIILPDANLRESIDEERFKELVDSIKTYGLIEPIVVEEVGGEYKLIAGLRRYLACRELGYETIPAVVRKVDEGDSEIITLEENITREDVNAIEEARYFQKILQKYNWTVEQLAGKLHRSVDYVYERLALLRAPEPLQKAVEIRAISFSTAKEIARIKDPGIQQQVFDLAVRTNASVEQVKQWRRSLEEDKEIKQPTPLEGNIEEYTPGAVGGTFVCPFCLREYPYSQAISLQVCGGCYVAIGEELRRLKEEGKGE